MLSTDASYYFPDVYVLVCIYSVYLSDLSIKDGPRSVCVASVSIGILRPGMF